MSEIRSVAVIGCGVFGAMVAIRLAESGKKVTVFERNNTPLSGASFNNQNRLHLGFHYPRDEETAKQCLRGFESFRTEFEECINSDFINAYFIASDKSFTSADNYLQFCDNLGLRYQQLKVDTFSPEIKHVDLGVACDEVVYDCNLLRDQILERLDNENITVRYGSAVTKIANESKGDFLIEVSEVVEGCFDAVVNCTYADINRLTEQLGYEVPKRQYEYTFVPIIEWEQPTIGVTVMDGKFMTVLPFGKSGKFLLYHVDYSVINRIVSHQMPSSWLDVEKAPLSKLDTNQIFDEMKSACAYFVPSLASAKITGFLQGPRMVLSKHDDDDARPSIVQRHQERYLSVFSGKIDHCVWVANEVSDALGSC